MREARGTAGQPEGLITARVQLPLPLGRPGASALLLVCLAALSAACVETAPRPVILIVVDTLRADHLGLYGYGRDTSPNLDRRAESALVFDRAYSSSSWTLPAFGTLYTGRFPAQHGAGRLAAPASGTDGEGARGRQRFVGLDTAFTTVAEAFAANGYATGAVLSNPFLDPSFGVARGFETYDHAPRRRADEIVDRSLEWIAGRDGPFFLMIHFMDPHLPYDPVDAYRGRFATPTSRVDYPVARVHEVRRAMSEFDDADRAFVRDAYDEEIAYLDSQLERLFAELERVGLWESALVVLTSDHGEEFFEHGGFEHGHAYFDEVTRVPLIAWGGAIGRVSEPASVVDVAPTLLAVIGGGTDLPGRVLTSGPHDGSRRGLALEGLLEARDERAVVLWPYKVVFDSDEPVQIYDLSIDPSELTNLWDGGEAMVAVAAAAGQTLISPRGELTPVDLDPDVVEQLRDIGYIR